MTDVSKPRPADIRPLLRIEVRKVVATGVTGAALTDALVEGLATFVDDLALRTFITWMGDTLTKMPEEQRKAKMFDVLMTLNPRVAGLLEEG